FGMVPGLDHDGRIELLDQGRAVEGSARRKPVATVDRRVEPTLLEPHATALEQGIRERRAGLAAAQHGERYPGAPADERGVQIHQHRSQLRQLHLEALPVRSGKCLVQLLDGNRYRWQVDAEQMALPGE